MTSFLNSFPVYLISMAGITYLIRMIPLVLCKKKIQNIYIRSFLYYVPYAVLGAMTIPAIFYSTSYILSASVGLVVALLLSFFKKNLIVVAAASGMAVLICEWIINQIQNTL